MILLSFFFVLFGGRRAGTREVHNKLEKNRRAHLRECFEVLRKQLPAVDDKKLSNLGILKSALRYIQVSQPTVATITTTSENPFFGLAFGRTKADGGPFPFQPTSPAGLFLVPTHSTTIARP